MATPHKDWAIEKVRTLVPPCKEKSTLLMIARYGDQFGKKCHPKIATIAKDSGHSVATVKRHIKQLVEDGQLLVDRQAFHGRSNEYTITVCRLTAEEREAIRITPADGGEAFGISRHQIKIPLPQKMDLSETVIPEISSERTAEVQGIIDDALQMLKDKMSIDKNISGSNRSLQERSLQAQRDREVIQKEN